MLYLSRSGVYGILDGLCTASHWGSFPSDVQNLARRFVTGSSKHLCLLGFRMSLNPMNVLPRLLYIDACFQGYTCVLGDRLRIRH